MRFLQPEAAIWLLAVPAIWCGWLLHRWYRDQARRVSGLGPRLATLAPMTGRRRDRAFLGAATLVAVALAFAAARPQMRVRTPELEQLDLILVLDRSVSMRAEDIRPSRLARASVEIRHFLRTAPETISRVGLIGFAGTALVMSHLTRDPEILFYYLDEIEADQEIRFGTDMAGALDSALTLARKDSPRRRKLVVLISDGDNQGGPLDAIVNRFQAARIPVYTVGIGSEAETPIPAARAGGRRESLGDDRGAVLTTRFSESTLRRLAGVTGGRYFRSTTGQELSAALAGIAEQERRIARWRDDYRDVHAYGVAAAAAALAVLLILL